MQFWSLHGRRVTWRVMGRGERGLHDAEEGRSLRSVRWVGIRGGGWGVGEASPWERLGGGVLRDERTQEKSPRYGVGAGGSAVEEGSGEKQGLSRESTDRV